MEEKKDIFDFIEKRPIETPDSSYFKDLADKVITDASASRLRSMPSESDQINSATNHQKSKIVPLYRKPIVWISGVAAAVLVAVLLIPDSSNPRTEVIPTSSLEPSKAEVLAYVNDNIDDFDEELLVEYIAMKNLDAATSTSQEVEEDAEPLETMIKTETKELQESLQNISDEEILEYLESEGALEEDDDFILL
ncbi:MAG: hypothetical protein NXI10_04145 [bacterium]|nr:hypothetical protein [bacterium]